MQKKPERFDSLTVMVADHDAGTRAVLRTLLRSLGIWQMVEVETVDTAKAAFDKDSVDIVICETDLGGQEGGFTLLAHLRNPNFCKDPYVPVIMLVQQGDANRVFKARNAGVHEMIVKPVTAETLLPKLRNLTLSPRPFVEVPTYFGPDRRQRGLRHLASMPDASAEPPAPAR